MKCTSKLFATAILAIFCTVACEQDNLTPTNPLHFGSVRFGNVKESFAEGTQMGLFAGEPINKTNVKLTVNAEGQLVPEDSIFWGAGQKTATAFLSYTPYDSTYTGGTVTFSVKEDQSSAANAACSDLMCAVSSASPSDSSVKFDFKHKMATALFWFDNRTGSPISSVTVDDICTSCSLSLSSGEVSNPSGSKTIKCYKANGWWQAVFVPQTNSLTISVTLENGKTYVKQASKAENFKSGSKYSTDGNPIILDDDTPKVLNMVFTVSDWTDGGQLNFNGEDSGEYTSLAQLAATAKSTASTFSGVKVKDVTVTKVYGSNVHIEDATAALLVYSSGHGLSEGTRINGEISGTILLEDGYKTLSDTAKAYAKLTALDCSKATLTTVSEAEYPLTTISIAEYLTAYRKYFNRRVQLKGITVDKGISSSVQSGTVSQSGSSLTIFNKGKEAEIGTGLTGDLICFMTANKSTLQALIYTSDQFTESGGEAEDTPFTRLTLEGAYSATDTESPSALRTYAEGSDQISCSKSSSSRKWCIFDLSAGSYMTLTLPVTAVSAGASIEATVNKDGTVESHNVTVVKKAGTKAWLDDKTNKVGYIITLQ